MWWLLACVLISYFPQDLAVLSDASYNVLNYVDYDINLSGANSTVLNVASTELNLEVGFATPAIALDVHNPIRKRRQVSYSEWREDADDSPKDLETSTTRKTTVLSTTAYVKPTISVTPQSEIYADTVQDVNLYPEELNGNDVTDLTRKTIYYPSTKNTPPVAVLQAHTTGEPESQNTIPGNEYQDVQPKTETRRKPKASTSDNSSDDWQEDLTNVQPVIETRRNLNASTTSSDDWQEESTNVQQVNKTRDKLKASTTSSDDWQEDLTTVQPVNETRRKLKASTTSSNDWQEDLTNVQPANETRRKLKASTTSSDDWQEYLTNNSMSYDDTEETQKTTIKSITWQAKETQKNTIKSITWQAEETQKNTIKPITWQAEETQKNTVKSITWQVEETQKNNIKSVTWQAVDTLATVVEHTTQKTEDTVTDHTSQKTRETVTKHEKNTLENDDFIRSTIRLRAQATWYPQTVSLTSTAIEETTTNPTYETSTSEETESIFVAPEAETVTVSMDSIETRAIARQNMAPTTTATTFKFNYRQVDAQKLLELFDYVLAGDVNQFNLSRKFNETLQKYNIPTCPDAPNTTTTEGPSTMNFNEAPVVAKCFVCGLEVKGIPYSSACADAFAGDFIPLVPVDPKAKGQIARYRKYCRYLDANRIIINEEEPHSVFGRFTGGCSVRWVDLTNVYTQRACRNRRRAVLGKHFASKRMAKLEMALNDVDNGCIISPMATLLPVSRGISLYARFHACVCTGSWCNRAIVTQHWIANTVLMLLILRCGT